MSDTEVNLMYDRIKDGRYYKAMVQNSPVPVFITDRTGRFLDANEAAATFLGHSLEEIRNMRFQEVTHRDDMILSMEMTNLLANGNQDHFEIVKRYLTKKGIAWAAIRVNAVRDEKGVLEVYVAHVIPLQGCTDDVMRDILGRMTGKCKTIEMSKWAFFAILSVAVFIEAILHWLVNR